MNLRTRSHASIARTLLLAFFLFALALPVVFGQQSNTDAAAPSASKANDAKAEQIVQRAIDALGGRAYLDVRTIVSRGYFTPIQNGISSLPITFTNYYALPDRERTEYKGQGVRSIQTHTGDTGWMYDGMSRKILDLKPEQVKNFRHTLRTSIDNILRGWWRQEGAHLSYVGRREGGLARRNEVVRLTYTDGTIIDFEFGASDGLPAKVRYKKENEEGELVEEEDRYAQFLSNGNVMVAYIIDHYRAGQQSSRVNYQAIEFNRPIPEDHFARPADVKSIK